MNRSQMLILCNINKSQSFQALIEIKQMLAKAGLQHLTKHLNSSSGVVMRADFNVPIKDGKIVDPKRVTATIPTIQQILKHNPKSLVMLSHLGRPNGQRNPKHSLKPITGLLEQELNRRITFLQDCVGQSVINRVKNSNNEIFLCENVRFHIEEEGSMKDSSGKKVRADPEKVKQFRNQLSQLGDCFVNDAFGTAHRAHSSVVGINHSFRVAGLLMEKQIKFLGNFLANPKKPVVAILGGAKVADKILLIKNLISFADQIIIGGGMKNPFLTHVFKKKLGASINIMPEDPNSLHDIIKLAAEKNCKLHFPVDYRVSHTAEMNNPAAMKIMAENEDVPEKDQTFDIGPESEKIFDEVISRAGSIFWNGPMGVIEVEHFRKGSEGILNSMIKATKTGTSTIIGGGDSASLVSKLGVEEKLSFVSTGGGATIELFEGKQLPGIKNLSTVEQLKIAQKVSQN